MTRDTSWDFVLDKVSPFNAKYNFSVPYVDDKLVAQGQPQCKVKKENVHHYCIELFYIAEAQQLF